MTLSCEASLDKVKEIKRNLTNLANPADFARFSFYQVEHDLRHWIELRAFSFQSAANRLDKHDYRQAPHMIAVQGCDEDEIANYFWKNIGSNDAGSRSFSFRLFPRNGQRRNPDGSSARWPRQG